MIKINDTDGLSRLLFLSDLYEMVLGIEGTIFHFGASEVDEEMWSELRMLYETPDDRCFFTFPDGHDVEEVSRFLQGLPPFIAGIVYLDDYYCVSDVVKVILETVVPCLVRGSVLVFSIPVGAVTAINEVIGLNNLSMQRWHHSRRDCYAVV
jgi:hypothetical protein